MNNQDLVEVKQLSHKGHSSVVQLVTDPTVRRVVSTDKIVVEKDKAFVNSYELELAMPYGVPWEYILRDFVISKDDLAVALREVGIWTFEDAAANPNLIRAAILQTARPAISAITEEAKKAKKFQGGSA